MKLLNKQAVIACKHVPEGKVQISDARGQTLVTIDSSYVLVEDASLEDLEIKGCSLSLDDKSLNCTRTEGVPTGFSSLLFIRDSLLGEKRRVCLDALEGSTNSTVANQKSTYVVHHAGQDFVEEV